MGGLAVPPVEGKRLAYSGTEPTQATLQALVLPTVASIRNVANIRNQCFANSVVQALLASPQFVAAVLVADKESKLRAAARETDRRPVIQRPLLTALANVFQDFGSATGSASFGDVHAKLEGQCPELKDGEPGDAQGYLLQVLDTLSEESNRSELLPMRGDPSAVFAFWLDRIVVYSSAYPAPDVKKRTMECALQRVLQVPMPADGTATSVTLQALLNATLGELDVVETGDSRKVTLVRATQLRDVQQYLWVNLQRFAFTTGGSSVKLTTPVRFFEHITLWQRTSLLRFRLVACVHHYEAALGNGHYVAYAQRVVPQTREITMTLRDEPWYLFDDTSQSPTGTLQTAEQVGEILKGDEGPGTAYLLLYRRVPGGPSQAIAYTATAKTTRLAGTFEPGKDYLPDPETLETLSTKQTPQFTARPSSGTTTPAMVLNASFVTAQIDPRFPMQTVLQLEPPVTTAASPELLQACIVAARRWLQVSKSGVFCIVTGPAFLLPPLVASVLTPLGFVARGAGAGHMLVVAPPNTVEDCPRLSR
jgi:hypothetical protein